MSTYSQSNCIDQPMDKTTPQEAALCAGNRRASCAMSNIHADDRRILGQLRQNRGDFANIGI